MTLTRAAQLYNAWDKAKAEAQQAEFDQMMQNCAAGTASTEECQKLIDDTIEYFNIDTNLTEGSDYSGVIISFDPDMSDEGGTRTEVGQDGNPYFFNKNRA
jgi:hypothetical protein